MGKKTAAAVCLAVSLGFRIFQHMHGQAVEVSMFFEPLLIGWLAFLMPVMMPVIAIERLVFNYAAWDDGHRATTIFYMLIAAVLFWCFPAGRIRRWFGAFDAFGASVWLRLRKRLGLPSFWQAAAAVQDTLHRLKLGKGKSGGWA